MRVFRSGIPLVLVLLLSIPPGCGQSAAQDVEDGFDTTTANEPPHANMVVQPATLHLNQNSSTTISIGVTRINFNGAVAFTVEGAPAGVTGSASTSSAAVAMTLTAGASTPVGTFPIVIRQKGFNIPDNTANVSLVVGPSTGHSFNLTINPASLSVTAGSSVTGNIAVSRSGATNEIVMLAENVPVFMTAGMSPNPIPATGSTLTITTNSRLTAGTYQLFIRGTCAGETDYVQPFTVVVH